MDANQILATGGTSGLVGVMGYLTYRFFFSKHRIVSRCCGREMSLEVDGSTPKPNNNSSLIDEHSSNESQCSTEREKRSQSPEGRNQERVSRGQEDEKNDKREVLSEGGVQEGQTEHPSTSNGQS